jgi:hypothetical protein
MGRFKPGATPEEIEEARAVSEEIWSTAVRLMAEESLHSLTCADPQCGGIIFPWLSENLTDVKTAVAFVSVVLERLADVAAGLAVFDRPGTAASEPGQTDRETTL